MQRIATRRKDEMQPRENASKVSYSVKLYTYENVPPFLSYLRQVTFVIILRVMNTWLCMCVWKGTTTMTLIGKNASYIHGNIQLEDVIAPVGGVGYWLKVNRLSVTLHRASRGLFSQLKIKKNILPLNIEYRRPCQIRWNSSLQTTL